MIELVYQLIGRLLLLLVRIYELLWQLRQRLYAFLCGSYDYFRGEAARERCDRAILEQCKAELTKRPQHLVLVLAPDEHYVNATLLKRIFDYALIMDIKHVSVYDKRDKSGGYVDLARFCEPKAGSLVWQPKAVNEQKSLSNGVKNGTANGYKNGAHLQELQLHQIGAADGHALIAAVCRELYEKRDTEKVRGLLLEKREALTEQISSMLSQRLGYAVPEPELGIIFGRQTCTYGLLPWHVRFTEFHTHRSGNYFDVQSFAQVLYRYARCEQRWGK